MRDFGIYGTTKTKNIRLTDYDYSQNGAYFITICTQNRVHLFGETVGAGLVSTRTPKYDIILNNAGNMIDIIYNKMFDKFICFKSDKYVIMPNHLHLIVVIERAETSPAPTIGDFVCAFKSKTTVAYINGVKAGIFPPFNKQIWQRNYYEHIIRNEEEFQHIRQYIDQNPVKWMEDCYYSG